MSKSQKVHAIFDDDLEVLLRKLGIYQQISEGKFKCFLCKEKVTLQNIQYVFSKKHRAAIICNKKECLACLDKLRGDGHVS